MPCPRPPSHSQTRMHAHLCICKLTATYNPTSSTHLQSQTHFHAHFGIHKFTSTITSPLLSPPGQYANPFPGPIQHTQTHIHAYTNIYANGIYCTYQKSSQTMACYSYHIKIHQLCFHHNRAHARHSISKPARTPTTTKSYMQGHHYAPTPFTPPAR